MEWFIISCFGSMILFIIILKEKELFIYYLNFLILAFSFMLMMLSIFQTKLKIEVKTETLILILFNLLVINYKMIVKIIQRIKKIKVGDTEVLINDFFEDKKELNKNLNDDVKDLRKNDKNFDSEFNSAKKFSIDSQDNKLIFLNYFFKIENYLRRIYYFFQNNGKIQNREIYTNKPKNKIVSVLDIYLTLIRNHNIIEIDEVSIELEKFVNVFITMINLRNILVHHFEDKVIPETKYKELFLIEEKILKNLEIIIKKYNIPKYASEK